MAKKAKRPYHRRNKIIQGLNEAVEFTKIRNAEWAALNSPKSVGNLPSLISDLASTIDNLEAQLTAQIDRIKSILK